MLIDLIPTEKLPWIIVWIDWNIYAFWPSMVASVIFFTTHYWIKMPYHSFEGISLAVFVGFCAWIASCAVRYGYAVG